MNPLTKIIPLKLLLDIVPSSSEDVTRAMRGQPKRFSRNYLRRNSGNVILYVVVSFHTRDVFCTLSRHLYGGVFVCFPASLAVNYFAVYVRVWGVKLSKIQLQWQRYFFVHFFAAVYKSSQNNNTKNSHILHISENVNYATANF